MIEYRTSSGNRYTFSGWKTGESPLECWDRQDWTRCLHGCMLCLSLIRNPVASHHAIEDDGLLHELVHLMQGIEINLHGSMEALRAQVNVLQNLVQPQILLEREAS